MSADEMLSDGCMSITEATQFTRLSRAELYLAMSNGRLRYVQHGRRRLLPKRALISMLSQGLTGSCEQAQQAA